MTQLSFQKYATQCSLTRSIGVVNQRPQVVAKTELHIFIVHLQKIWLLLNPNHHHLPLTEDQPEVNIRHLVGCQSVTNAQETSDIFTLNVPWSGHIEIYSKERLVKTDLRLSFKGVLLIVKHAWNQPHLCTFSSFTDKITLSQGQIQQKFQFHFSCWRVKDLSFVNSMPSSFWDSVEVLKVYEICSHGQGSR